MNFSLPTKRYIIYFLPYPTLPPKKTHTKPVAFFCLGLLFQVFLSQLQTLIHPEGMKGGA